MAKKNYNYGKIVDGKLKYAPNKLIVDKTDEDGNERSVQVFNASAGRYNEQGWLPITRTPQPEPVEGGYYTAEYTEQDNGIVESWQFVEFDEENAGVAQ